MSLTGSTRYRVGWFGKLIMQVEEIVVAGVQGPSLTRAVHWRDANVTDMQELAYEKERRRCANLGLAPPDWH